MCTIVAILVEVMVIIVHLALFRQRVSTWSLSPLVYSPFVFINGVNVLNADEGNAYISAGFTYLVGTILSLPMLVLVSLDARVVLDETDALAVAVVLYSLRAVVDLIATPCALYAGYFWSNGRSTNTTARTTRSASEQGSTTRDLEAGSCSHTACAGFEPPQEAPSQVYITWYATVAALVFHGMLLVQPAFVEFPHQVSIAAYYIYCYFSTPPVFVVGAILLRSFRKATFRSAGFIYIYASVHHCAMLSIDGDSGRFFEGDRCVIPVACLISLLVGMVAAFWSCPYLPSSARHVSDNGKASRRPTAYAETGPTRGFVEPPVRSPGRGRVVEFRSEVKSPL